MCRKIGEKMRLSPSEQAEHVLIAIYARPSAATASSCSSWYDSATDSSGGGGGLEGVAAGAAGASNGDGGASSLKSGSGKGDSVEGVIAEKRERRREVLSNSRTGR